MNTENIRILLVSHSQDLARETGEILCGAEEGIFHLVVTDTLPDAAILEKDLQPDIVFIDIRDSDAPGIRMLNDLRFNGKLLPVVILAPPERENDAYRAFIDGAQDYILLDKLSSSNVIKTIRSSILRNDALFESERRTEDAVAAQHVLRTVIESNADAVLLVDMDNRVLFANPAAEDMFRRPMEELAGSVIGYPILTGDSVEIDVLRKDGEPMIAEMRASEVEWEGRPAYISSIRDITGRKRMEMDLNEVRRELEEIIDFLPDATFVINCEKKVIAWNRALENMTGFPKERMLGTGDYSIPFYGEKRPILADLLSVSDPETEKRYSHIIRENGRIVAEVFIDRLFDGRGAHVWIAAAPIYDEAGMFIGAIESIRDITMRKHLEEQLQIRQRMDSLGVLAGGIAHDFNNLLTGIMGNISMLDYESGDLSAVHRQYVRDAKVSCERAAELIRKFQTLSDGAVTAKKSLDLYYCFREVFAILQRTTDKLIEKDIDFLPGVFFVMASEGELNQVFLNLGMNSIHAIESRGAMPSDFIRVSAEKVRLSVSDSRPLEPGRYIHIRFADSGIGMDEDTMRKAFDPLFSTREKGPRKGQGLGLAMAYNIIVRNHNGFIEIESTPGRGSVFHVYLPAADPVEKTDTSPGGDLKMGRGTILVIEDEKIVRDLVGKMLTKLGYEVMNAYDGRQGLKMFMEHGDDIDLVLLDLTMPKMSGEMVLSRMLDEKPDVKVVISSGHSEGMIPDELVSRTMGYLVKPYHLNEMADCLRSALES